MTTTVTDLATATGTWVLDVAHSSLAFTARHAVITKVRGKFTDFSGSLNLNGDNIADSKAELTIVAASFDSANNDRDAHVKSADFLDVENFPALTFTSTGVRQGSGNEFVVDGDLTIHGQTRPVSIKAEYTGIATDPWGNTKIGFEGKTTISRKDFGLTWNVALEAGGVLVSDKIDIELDVQATKQA